MKLNIPKFALARKDSPYRPSHARHYPTVLQVREMDCGAACIAMVLHYYRKRVSINRLRDLAGVSRDGTSLYNLATAAEALGFKASPVRTSLGRLEEIELPAIAHWEGTHFVVLYDIKDQHVVIGDPAIGLRRLSRE